MLQRLGIGVEEVRYLCSIHGRLNTQRYAGEIASTCCVERALLDKASGKHKVAVQRNGHFAASFARTGTLCWLTLQMMSNPTQADQHMMWRCRRE